MTSLYTVARAAYTVHCCVTSAISVVYQLNGRKYSRSCCRYSTVNNDDDDDDDDDNNNNNNDNMIYSAMVFKDAEACVLCNLLLKIMLKSWTLFIGTQCVM